MGNRIRMKPLKMRLTTGKWKRREERIARRKRQAAERAFEEALR